jgi:hypothetical protein
MRFLELPIRGSASLTQGQLECATQLLGATAALFGFFDPVMDPTDRADYERAVAAARAHLDTATFDTASAAARAMPVEQAIARFEAEAQIVARRQTPPTSAATQTASA